MKIMVSRCVSAIDEVNSIALGLEKKHRKSDVCHVAKETLERLKREKQLIGSSWKEARKARLMPKNAFHQSKKHELQRQLPDHNAKWGERSTPSSTNSSKKNERNIRRAHAASLALPTTILDYGKSYANRCVKEILNKIENGPYASEWYNFSSPNMPSPKWINFNLDESGGVLDAFLCKKDDDGHACYMMDVRIGEKVGRLFKYPGPIRVGQNGHIAERKPCKDSDDVFLLDHLVPDDNESKETKSRPFPLCWSEQLDWKDAKVLSVADKNVKHNVEQVRRTEQKSIRESESIRKGPIGIRYRPAHNYALEPVNVKVIQNLPCVKTRQKRIRGFYISGRGEHLDATKAADQLQRIEGTEESVRWVGKTNRENGKKGITKKYKDFLSPDVRKNDKDVEVETHCADEHDKGGERQKNIGLSGKQNRTVKFQRVTVIGNEVERAKEDSTNLNHSGNEMGGTAEHFEYIGGGEVNNELSTNEAKGYQKHQAPLSRIVSNKQTQDKEQEMFYTSNGNGMARKTAHQSEVIVDVRRKLDGSQYSETDGAVQETIKSVNHAVEDAINSANSSGQERDNARHETEVTHDEGHMI